MKPAIRTCMAAAMTFGAAMLSGTAMVQAQDARPNILFIMGDDIGWMQPSIYSEGLGLGETPNIDRIGHEGAKFIDYLALQSGGHPEASSGGEPPERITSLAERAAPSVVARCVCSGTEHDCFRTGRL